MSPWLCSAISCSCQVLVCGAEVVMRWGMVVLSDERMLTEATT